MRILSYNIHKGIGGTDRQYSLDRIISVIESQNPDLICLQEVDRHAKRSRHDNQPQLLAEQFRSAAHDYQLNVHLTEGGGYGNLILSRWPFRSRHHVSLRYQKSKPRAAQLVVVETPEGPLQLVNWHLSLTGGMRRWQATHLLGHKLFLEAADLPALIIGDSNDWRNQLHKVPFQAHGFRHITAPLRTFRSFPAVLAMGALDKAFIRGEVDVRHAFIVRSKLAKQASDHLPLVIDFHLAKEVHHKTANKTAK
jgi:endonuclease/exonuclease/phosphatase family metal-dependent hydrolase